MKSTTAIIDWYGPYTTENVGKVTKFDYDDGLYMVLGKKKYERAIRLQYIGIASNLHNRLNSGHPRMSDVVKERQIWLGEVASPRTPGKKIKVTDRLLDLAEWAHVYFLQIPLNDKKKKYPPDHPIVVYNRWWKTDYETLYARRPHRDWPDLIDFLNEQSNVKVIWFGSRQVVKPVCDFCG